MECHPITADLSGNIPSYSIHLRYIGGLIGHLQAALGATPSQSTPAMVQKICIDDLLNHGF